MECLVSTFFITSTSKKEVVEFASLQAYMQPISRENIPRNERLFTIRGKGVAYPNTGLYFVEALIVDPGKNHG